MADPHPPGGPVFVESSSDGMSSSMVLLARAKAGDQHALDELLARYLSRLKHWISGRLPGRCRSLCDTDDLVQETIVRVAKALPDFEVQHEAGLQAYLRQALWNRLREEIRRTANGRDPVELDESLPAAGPSPLEQAIGSQALERYETALNTLSYDERSAVVGRLEFGYSYAELALMLGRRTPDAARKIVERALPQIAASMRAASETPQ